MGDVYSSTLDPAQGRGGVRSSVENSEKPFLMKVKILLLIF